MSAAKQTTWNKSHSWKTVGTVKRRTAKVQICKRAEGDFELHIFNRIFKYGSEAAAKAWCETPSFLETYDLLASQWSKAPVISTQAALEAASVGLGRGCVSAPETFLF